MEVNKIFGKINQECNLLDKLKDKRKLVFLGEKETIDYLQRFFKNNNSQQRYYAFSEDMDINIFFEEMIKSQCYAVIVSSVIDENTIFNKIKNYVGSLSLKIPVLRLFADIFVNLKSGYKLMQSSECQLICPKVAYAIVSTPRSGSTALCTALTSTKVAGFPREHLRHDSAVITKNCNFDYIKYLKILMSCKVTDNGVFGTKFISHFLQAHEDSKFNFNQIVNEFKWIYLVRRNKQKQAVSLFLAKESNVWHAHFPDKYQEYMNFIATLNFKESDILKGVYQRYNYLLKQENYLELFFDKFKVCPLVIEYEDFADSNERCVEKIFNYLNINISGFQKSSLFKARASTHKLGSNLAEEILQKYQEKYGL